MKDKLGFIHLPKTAGTPIGEYFIKYNYSNKFVNFGHTPILEIKDRQNYFLFGFIRNPFDWYVSRYAYFIKKDSKEHGISKANDAGTYSNDFKKQFKTLKQHIQYGMRNEKRLNRFWFSKIYNYMFKIDGEIALDYIGKVENINYDIDFLCKKFNIEPKKLFNQFCINNPNKMNKSIRTNYKGYYDDALIKIIYNKDKEIFEKYNYKF